jgi:hypothetical protein
MKVADLGIRRVNFFIGGCWSSSFFVWQERTFVYHLLRRAGGASATGLCSCVWKARLQSSICCSDRLIVWNREMS